MNRYYCTGEEIENGYLKCVVPEFLPLPDEDEVNDNAMMRNQDEAVNWESHIKSLPLAALVVGGKTGWLEGYEERYERNYTDVWSVCTKEDYLNCPHPDWRRIVLVKKKEKSEDEVEELFHAHLGITGGKEGKNHLSKYPSLICSQCGDSRNSINFQITQGEYDRFKKLLANSEENPAPVVEDRPK